MCKLLCASCLAVCVVSFGLLGSVGIVTQGFASPGSEAGCALHQTSKTAAALKSYTEDELKVIRYIADRLEKKNINRFDEEEIAKGAGVPVAIVHDLSQLRIEQGVIAEMNLRGIDIGALAGNCASFSACSIDHDLSAASGDELARYKKEKIEDGEAFDAWSAPDFTLTRTSGPAVSLSDYRGQDVAVVFLSGHCNHSMATLPLLEQLGEEFKDRNLTVLPVYINSGSAEDIRGWSTSIGVDIPLLVAEEKDLADEWDFRMVPSFFLINEDGMVTKKLVGQKDKETLTGALTELIGS